MFYFSGRTRNNNWLAYTLYNSSETTGLKFCNENISVGENLGKQSEIYSAYTSFR